MTLLETQKAIRFIQEVFETNLEYVLNLTKVKAPIALSPELGLNDLLDNLQPPVHFSSPRTGISGEVVHSLAKWKRLALKKFKCQLYEGIYADMRAIRKDEELDRTHSIYVDQYDWELVIDKKDRNLKVLKQVVQKIYEIIRFTQIEVNKKFNLNDQAILPKDITFISTKDLRDLYPDINYKQREQRIVKQHKAVFIIGVGHKLDENTAPHEIRAADYDDWNLNGDLLVWNPKDEAALELSSMGIRVDENSLVEQLKITNQLDFLKLPFHDAIVKKQLPYSIGGGIGQSRLFYFLLQKSHIGEVIPSIWTPKIIEELNNKDIEIL